MAHQPRLAVITATTMLALTACTSTSPTASVGTATTRSADPASDRTDVLALTETTFPKLASAFDADYWSCRGSFRSTTFTETPGQWYEVQVWLRMDELDPSALAAAFADAGFDPTTPTNPHNTVSATHGDITLSASIYYEHRQRFEFVSPVRELPEYSPPPAEYDDLPVCGDASGAPARE
jgi:hypothetical protein